MHGPSEKKTLVTLKRTAVDNAAKTIAILSANIEDGVCKMVNVSLVAGANMSLDNFNELLGSAILLQNDIISEVTDPVPPVITNVQAINITTISATIVWLTDQLSDSVVNYGIVSGVLSIDERNDQYYNVHSITLNGLSANTTYYYRVVSKNSNNDVRVSSEYSFTTLSA